MGPVSSLARGEIVEYTTMNAIIVELKKIAWLCFSQKNVLFSNNFYSSWKRNKSYLRNPSKYKNSIILWPLNWKWSAIKKREIKNWLIEWRQSFYKFSAFTLHEFQSNSLQWFELVLIHRFCFWEIEMSCNFDFS